MASTKKKRPKNQDELDKQVEIDVKHAAVLALMDERQVLLNEMSTLNDSGDGAAITEILDEAVGVQQGTQAFTKLTEDLAFEIDCYMKRQGSDISKLVVGLLLRVGAIPSA